MKKRGRLAWWLGLGAVALLLLCAAAAALVYFQARGRAFNSRPLVLIQSPANHEQAQIGDGIMVHATARANRGVSRMELWVDEVFVSARDQPAEEPTSPLVFNASWTPASVGRHALLVRAVSADGVYGQAALVVDVVGEEEAALGGHTAQEGESVASIAGEHRITEEEVVRLNPGVEAGGIEPGEVLTVPGGEVPSEEPPAEAVEEPGPEAPEEGPAPTPEEDAPGDFVHVMWGILPFDLIPAPGPSSEPVNLRIEALSLQTDAAYEGLHCYIGMAGASPSWYPDADGDQTTDESFAQVGDRMWNVAEYLSGEAAPVISWPGNEPLSLDATCVGILGGGTEAIELGRLLLEVPPSQWDGVARWSPEVSAEGSFMLEYRIGPAVDTGISIVLDPSMTPPTNLRLSSSVVFGNSLYWSYEPRPREDPIDGFRVYLNGTLLWVEPADARTTTLPGQWMFPCAEPYTFTVTAFRGTYPDGPESTPSEPPVIIEAEPEHCQRVVYVTFHNLTTHDLGGDGRYEDRSGDVGPAYGYFNGNDQQVSFDGRPEDSRQGLNHNSQYVIRDLWNVSGPAQLRVELAEGEWLGVGFHIDNEDTGRCRDAGDPGCDNLICEAEDVIDVDVDTTSQERTVASRDGRCEVTYTLGLGAGFPAESYGGELPLPWLTVEDVTMTEGSQMRIHVRNDGRASWSARDVKAAITRPSGQAVYVLTWPAVSLDPGERTILQTATMNFEPLPVCVTLDPDNEVGEWGDALEARGVIQAHPPSCMKLPDLAITGVEYDPEAGHLLVAVQNQGEGVLENRTVALSHRPLGGGPPAAPMEHASISLQPSESTVLTMTADEGLHSAWFEGYRVTVDPDNLIAESDNDNNSHTVPGGSEVRLEWTHIRAPWHARNGVAFEMRAYAVSSGTRREIANWKIGPDIDWASCGHDVTHGECDKSYSPSSPYSTAPFPIAGDEALQINVTITNERPVTDDYGHTVTWLATGETYDAADDWGAGGRDPSNGCNFIIEGPGDHGWVLDSYSEWAASLGYYHDWDWYVNFNLCH